MLSSHSQAQETISRWKGAVQREKVERSRAIVNRDRALLRLRSAGSNLFNQLPASTIKHASRVRTQESSTRAIY